MKRILVTGGAGFIGTNLVRLLVSEDYEVCNVDKLTYAGSLAGLADITDKFRFEQADICDAQKIHEIIMDFKPDGIMHLAAESHVDRSISGPGEFIQTNVIGTFRMLEAALDYWKSLDSSAQEKFRFLHVSTDEVYGALPLDGGMFNEMTRYDPHSPYSASKASSDHLARAWHDTYKLPVLITNCSNNYGPYQNEEKLIPHVIQAALNGSPIPVYGEGLNVRDWLYVEDHCRALLKVITTAEAGQTYNIGGNNEWNNISLVRSLCSILDELHPRKDNKSYSEQITFVTDRPGHDLRYAIDPSKIRADLGWSPLCQKEEGFRKTVSWYLTKFLA